MSKRTFISILLPISLLLSSAAAVGSTPPSEIQSSLARPVLIGQAKFTYLVFDVYDATLWAQKSPWSMDQKFALSLVYERDIDQQGFIDSSIEEMSRYFNLSADEQSYRTELANILPDVVQGDRITAVYNPGVNLDFYHNGQSVGRITDPEFAKRYIQIWLHPNAYYSGFKNKLIGGNR